MIGMFAFDLNAQDSSGIEFIKLERPAINRSDLHLQIPFKTEKATEVKFLNEESLDITEAVKEPLKDVEFIEPDEIEESRKSLLKNQFIVPTETQPTNFPIERDFNAYVPKKFENADKFHWKSAIADSLLFLGIQHSFRMLQTKTRDELNGKFFADWGESVRNLGRWRDGDSFATNYIAHPMQGAVTGHIFINNSDKAKRQEFGESKEYWESRFKTALWSAVWSVQFELGPVSEASIGNVGLYDRVGPNRMGWVDLVVTPLAGTGVIIGEDVIDMYILKKWLEKGQSRTRIKLLRTFFTPFKSFTNVLRFKVPWRRDNRQ